MRVFDRANITFVLSLEGRDVGFNTKSAPKVHTENESFLNGGHYQQDDRVSLTSIFNGNGDRGSGRMTGAIGCRNIDVGSLCRETQILY